MSIARTNNLNPVSINFVSERELDNWVVVNDVVMGGRSRANIEITDSFLWFSGTLSLENNGGFASIRRVYDSKAWLSNKVIHLKVTGDGRRYQFRLRTNRRVDGIAYVANFTTAENAPTEITFSEADFIAQFRGRRVSGAPPLDFADIEQVGIMLADKDEGEFMLKIKSISQQN